MRCKYLAILASIIGLLALSAPANAVAPIKTKPASFVLVAGSPVPVKVTLPKATYSQVCFNFQFSANDGVDPGEEVDVDVAPPDTLGLAGFVNLGTSPIFSRTLCLIDPDQVAVFNDGHQGIEVHMPTGSAIVDSFTISPS